MEIKKETLLETPKLYLSDYYSNLKNEIDASFVSLESKEPLSDENKSLWKQMIEKIQFYEDENLKQCNSKLTTKLEELKETSDINELKKVLFLNKTIITFKIDESQLTEKVNEFRNYRFYDSDEETEDENETSNQKEGTESRYLTYLLIINDLYLDETLVKDFIVNKRTAFEKGELTRESVAYDYLSNKINFESRIIEINFDLVTVDAFKCNSNSLEIINPIAFKDFQYLNLIDLSKNNLTKIDDDSFQNLTNLKNLWLNDNKIETISKNAFKSLSNLQWLDLSNNLIKSIDETTFSCLVSLELLDLENNQIAVLKPLVFRFNTNLKNLFMKNKPFVDRLIFEFTTVNLDNKPKKQSSLVLNEQDCSNLFGKNLLKNSNAESGFKDWTPTDLVTINSETNVRDIIDLIKKSKIKSENNFNFVIETEQNGAKHLLKDDNKSLYKCFSTTYYLGCKYQVIDLDSQGVNEAFFNKYKPNIEVGENYVARNDCGSIYYLNVYLLNSYFQIIKNHTFERTMEQWADLEWQLESHTFEYDDTLKSLRYILFNHGGKVRFKYY